jgi:hypothetical protein
MVNQPFVDARRMEVVPARKRLAFVWLLYRGQAHAANAKILVALLGHTYEWYCVEKLRCSPATVVFLQTDEVEGRSVHGQLVHGPIII